MMAIYSTPKGARKKLLLHSLVGQTCKDNMVEVFSIVNVDMVACFGNKI